MTVKQKIFLALLAVAVLFASGCFFTVREGEVGIVFRFGKVIRADGDGNAPAICAPGLYFKLPLIDQVKKIDVRIQSLDSQADRFVTSEKKDLMIDSYVKWQITDPALFFLSTNGGDYFIAADLLKNKINNGLRSEIGSRTISEIVSGERSEVMESALLNSASSQELGIKVIDVRIKQINLPVEVSHSIYERMKAERTAVAKEHRANGTREAEFIRAEVDKEVEVMLAEAQMKSRQIRGDGDAKALKIYADTYSLNPGFFDFMRSMEAYKKSMHGQGNVLVVSPDNEFFSQFGSVRGTEKMPDTVNMKEKAPSAEEHASAAAASDAAVQEKAGVSEETAENASAGGNSAELSDAD